MVLCSIDAVVFEFLDEYGLRSAESLLTEWNIAARRGVLEEWWDLKGAKIKEKSRC